MMIRLPILLMTICALALMSCGGSATASRPAGGAKDVHISDFKITPAAITISGSSMTLAVHNDGPTVHNLTVRDASGKVVASTKTLKPGDRRLPAFSWCPEPTPPTVRCPVTRAWACAARWW